MRQIDYLLKTQATEQGCDGLGLNEIFDSAAGLGYSAGKRVESGVSERTQGSALDCIIEDHSAAAWE